MINILTPQDIARFAFEKQGEEIRTAFIRLAERVLMAPLQGKKIDIVHLEMVGALGTPSQIEDGGVANFEYYRNDQRLAVSLRGGFKGDNFHPEMTARSTTRGVMDAIYFPLMQVVAREIILDCQPHISISVV